MAKIYNTTDFPINDVRLGTPFNKSGVYFIKLSVDDAPIYIQPPKCSIKQGFIKSGKKIFCDLIFSIEDNSFLAWLEQIEGIAKTQIYENRAKWFETELDEHDIENSLASPYKMYKSGKLYIIRANIPNTLGKSDLKIYDESEREIFHEDLKEDTNVIAILEFKGIKCSARSFQFDMDVRQMLVVSPVKMFEKCMIRTSGSNTNSYELRSQEFQGVAESIGRSKSAIFGRDEVSYENQGVAESIGRSKSAIFGRDEVSYENQGVAESIGRSKSAIFGRDEVSYENQGVAESEAQAVRSKSAIFGRDEVSYENKIDTNSDGIRSTQSQGFTESAGRSKSEIFGRDAVSYENELQSPMDVGAKYSGDEVEGIRGNSREGTSSEFSQVSSNSYELRSPEFPRTPSAARPEYLTTSLSRKDIEPQNQESQDQESQNQESQYQESQNQESQNQDVEICEIELDLEKIENGESVHLKNRNDVYYKMYKEAKRKAKEAKLIALSNYLEAKRIKHAYSLDDSEGESEDDLEDEFSK
jgi:hypothetical protein